MDLNLPNLGNLSATEAVYDSASQQIILADNATTQSYSLASQKPEFRHSLPQENELSTLFSQGKNENATPPLNSMCLRFHPANAQSNLHISCSGLLVTSLTKDEEIAIANIGFRSGVHYWEVICPKSCTNISIGVIKEGWSISNPSVNAKLLEAQTFRTTTSRTVGLRLDLNKGEFKCWLNGLMQPSKTRTIEKGVTYYPCIKIKEKGNHAILNPFAVDPESPLATLHENRSKIPIPQVKEALENWVIFSGFAKTEKKNLITKVTSNLDLSDSTPSEYLFDDNTSILGLRFKTPEEAALFVQKNAAVKIDGKQIYVLEREYIDQWAINIAKEGTLINKVDQKLANADQINTIMPWFKRNFNSLVRGVHQVDLDFLKGTTKSISEQLRKYQETHPLEESKFNVDASAQAKFEYNTQSKNLLIVRENMLKLAIKSHDLLEFPLHQVLFKNRPIRPKDNITIPMSIETLNFLILNLQLEAKLPQLSATHAEAKAVADFFKAIELALSEKTISGDIIYLRAPYKSFKRVVDLLTNELVTTISKNKQAFEGVVTLIDTKNVPPVKECSESDQLPSFESLKDASPTKKMAPKNEPASGTFSDLTLNTLYTLINTLLTIDEALFAMIQHEDASPKFQFYWQNKNARVFSSFCRLSSFLNFPSNRYSPLELAENGLYNTTDLLYDVRHFLDPEKRIDAIQNLRPEQNLSLFLEKSLPENRMLQGLPSTNVPLSTTINNLPAQYHSRGDDLSKTKILKVAQHPDSSQVATVSNNGDVKIWNTEIGLVNLATDNFRRDFNNPELSLLKSKNATEEVLGVGTLPTEEPQTKQPEAQFVPDPGMVEALYNMGFSIELAKKALAASQNAGIAAALDKILVIQEEEKNKAATAKKTTTVTRIKSEWACEACTFINKPENKLCEICEQPAPMDAYVTEEEPKEETTQTPEAKTEDKVTEETISEEEKKKIQEQELFKAFIANADITDAILLNMKNSGLCPTVVGVVFNDKNKSLLRLRHYAYSDEYLKKFITIDPQRGIYSNLSCAWFNSQASNCIKDIENHLLKEYHLAFTALEPLFIGNLRYKVPETYKPSLFAGDLISLKELDLPLTYDRVLSVAASPSRMQEDKELIDLFILGKNKNETELAHYRLTNTLKDPYTTTNAQNTLTIELIKTHEVKFITGNTAEAVLTESNELVILDIESNIIHVLATDDVSKITSTKLSYTIKNAKVIGRKAFLITDSQGHVHALEISKGYFNPPQTLQSQVRSKKEAIMPSVKDLTGEEIDSLRRTLCRKYPSGILKTFGAIPSRFEKLTESYSKFFLSLQGESRKVLEFELSRPTSLLSVNIDLQFDKKSQEAVKDEKDFFEKLHKYITTRESEPTEETQIVSPSLKEKKPVMPMLTFSEGEVATPSGGTGNNYLPLTVVTFKGASFNEKFPVSRMLVPNSDVFLSNYPNTEFIFQHLHEKTITVQSVTVRSNFRPHANGGYPIGSGLIFTSNHLAHFDMTTPFHDMNHQEYQTWLQERMKSDKELEPWEPVGSFLMDEKSEIVTIELDFKRPAKYVFLKPTGMRSKPDNYTKFFKTSALEIKFFGVSGIVVEDDVQSISMPKRNLESGLKFGEVTNSTVTVEVNTGTNSNPEWVEIYNNKGAPLPVNEILYGTKNSRYFLDNKNLFNAVMMNGRNSLEISSELFASNIISSIRVSATTTAGSESSSGEWELSGLSAYVTASDHNEPQQGAHEDRPALLPLRTLLLDSEKFKKFNQQLVEQLVEESCPIEKRKKISKLLSDLFSQLPDLVEVVYRQLDLYKYLELNVLRETNSSFIEVLTLLKNFVGITSFPKDLLSALKKILPSLSESSYITAEGLNGFFSLLNWCSSADSEGVFMEVLNELEKIVKKIKQHRAPEYNLLRAQYNISSMVFEKELFSDANTSKKPPKKKDSSKKETEKKNKRRDPIRAKIAAYYGQDVDEYLIDLCSEYNVKEVRIAFDQCTKSTKFRVQAWAISPGQSKEDKKLLHSQFYTEATWIQLTSYAYDTTNNSNYFQETEELEVLGFNDINTTARYLLVQISYAVLPSVQTLTEKIDKKALPEIYGDKVEGVKGDQSHLKELESFFESNTLTFAESVSYPHTLKYDKYDVSGQPLKKVFDSTGHLKKDPSKVNVSESVEQEASIAAANQENIEASLTQLANLQAELLGKLQSSRNHESFTQSQEEVRELCDEIESVQLTLLNSQYKPRIADTTEPKKSLDFLYTLANKLSQFLRKIDSHTDEPHRKWKESESLKKERGIEIAYSIFETIVIFETTQISKEFTNFLSQIIIPTLDSYYSHELIFKLIDNFLSLPVSMTTSPVETIFSHTRAIEALEKLTIHNGELLSYLVSKLNIPVAGTSSPQIKPHKEMSEKSTITILASVLLLLSRNLKNQLQGSSSSSSKPATTETVEMVTAAVDEEEIKQTFKFKDTSMDIVNFNYETSLKATFYICVWICEHPTFSLLDKSNILAIGFDLLMSFMYFSKPSGIKDILLDPKSFLKLFMSTMRLSSPNLLKKFKGLLNAFLQIKTIAGSKLPKSSTGTSTPVDEQIAEETKILLIKHLQNVLNSLLSYALQKETSKEYLLGSEELSPVIWLEYVCFIMDFLLLGADKVTQEGEKKGQKGKAKPERKGAKEESKQQEETTPLIATKEDEKKIDEFNVDKFDKSNVIPLEAVKSLIQLLSPETAREGFNFSNSTNAWGLVMKAILKVKITYLIETKVFDSLVRSFLQASEDIQQIMFPEILTLTKNMVTHPNSQKELCNNVLDVIFRTLHESDKNGLYEPIAFSLLKGWLDILLTKQTPKPEDFYAKVPAQPAFCKLNAQGAQNLLTNLSSYLIENLNLGGRDGVQNCSELNVVRLQIADDLLRLLISCESTASYYSISELFSNFKKYQKHIEKAMYNFIEWFMLNRTTEAGISPATDLIKSISDSLLRLFTLSADYEEVAKVSISALIQICRQIDQSVLKLQSGQQISGYVALTYNSRACKILEELFDVWVVSDSVASHVAFEVKGFEYLLDRMGISTSTTGLETDKSSKTESAIQSNTSLLEGTDLLDFINLTKEALPLDPKTKAPTLLSNTATTNNDDPKEEEFANKLTIINQPGQNWTGITPDWSLNKKGVRARILFFVMNGASYNEYCLVFNLDKVVELKQIKIGFNSVWTDYSDKVLGVPSSVLVEGGTSVNDLSPIGTLTQINDEGYINYSVKCLHKNFQMMTKSDGTIDESLSSLAVKRVSCLKFRFRRPIITFMENTSMLSTKKYQNIAVSISFISILGYDVSKLPNIRKKLVEAQEGSALQVVGKLCNQNFVQTLTALANQESVISKIEQSFDLLASLLVPHESWLAPVFLAIATHNQKMGDWIIKKFLDTSRSKEHAKMVGEIILTNNDLLYNRLEGLNTFVLSELNKYVKLNTADSLNKFNSLVHFIETLCSCVRSVPVELVEPVSEGKQKPQQIELAKENIDDIVAAFESFNASPQNSVLIKLLLLYLYIPAPFVVKDLSQGELIQYTLEKLWDLIQNQKKTIYYQMIGPVIIGSKGAIKWFVPHLDKFLDEILSMIEAGKNTASKQIRHSLSLMHNLSRNKEIKRIIAEKRWHLNFYDRLKNENANVKSVLKELDQDILVQSVELLKNLVVGYDVTETEMANKLKDDLILLENKRDMFFVNNVLVPLLNAESEIPVCLHPYDPHARRWITDGKKLSNVQTQAPQSEFIKSKLLTKDQSEMLQKTLKQFTTPSGLYRKISQSEWQLAIHSNGDSENVLELISQKMSKQGPFLIILEGLNAGKRCFVGMFSSQSIPELPAQFDTSYDQSYHIPLADDCFLFYYEEEFGVHFAIPSSTSQNYFGQVHTFYDGGGGISFYYNGTERIFISHAPSQTTFVDINLYDMKPLEEGQKALPSDIPAEFTFKSAEYWVLRPGAPAAPTKDKKKNTISSLLYPAWYSANQPLNYYRASPVYNVPSSITVGKMIEIMLGTDMAVKLKQTHEELASKTTVLELYNFAENDPSANNIIDIEFDAVALVEKQYNKKDTSSEPEKDKNNVLDLKYMPAMTIFEAFEKNQGVESIIEVTLKSLTHWKDKEKSKRWFAWVQELSSFSSLPNFFGLFLKNKECIELLFQLLAGVPDEDSKKDKKKWEDEEQMAVKFSYQILAGVFRVDSDIKVREFAIEKQFFERILDRIAIISKEFKRKWNDEIKEEVESPDTSSPQKKDEEDDGKKKVVKKKGIGYASDNTGQNSVWNTKDYVENKKVRNEQLLSMLEIIRNFLDTKDWSPPKKVLHSICESALLPLLEAAFRSGSLLDMGKEADLYFSYLKLTRVMSQHKILIPALLELDRHYHPKQKDPICNLLKTLKDTAQIFLNCLTTASDQKPTDASLSNQKLAEDIVQTYNIVDEAISAFREDDDGEDIDYTDILNQTLPIKYKYLLKDLRFDYTDMKDQTGKYKHHYTSMITTNYTPPQAKMVRLAQELADLSNSLPIEHTNSIFVRVDQSRVDVMKAVIMGASGTPYAHGAFEYDIFLDDSYPNAPPKVNLTTTGSGRIRFNPNLYSCGKVCLSLLGTWRGNSSENWDPKISTLLQVLVSIQAIIMSEEVYFNEPGFEGEAGTEEGEKKNEAYCNIVRYGNIKFAMIDQIKNPPKGFETVVRRHFYLKKDEILEETRKWLKYAEVREANYTGLVNDHNHQWCSQFKASKNSYKDMLAQAIKELETELNKLAPPSGKDLEKKVSKKKKQKDQKGKEGENVSAGIANLDEIDVTYEKDVKYKELSVDDASVRDRWSRYIGAMGMDAVARQANATVFISGLGALGVEIAKNIVLSGVRQLTVHDDKKATYRDLSGQFFLSEADIGKNRVTASLDKIQQLNYYVKVVPILLDQKLPTQKEEIEKLIKGHTLVILSECDYDVQLAFDAYCRENGIYFISTDCYGPFTRVFTDFGKKFTVLDKNGEEVQEVMIKSITNAERGIVTLLPGAKHKFEDGDTIIITQVEGMELLDKGKPIEIITDKGEKATTTSINGTLHKVETINSNSFKIGDTRGFTPYVRNGLAKQIKTPIEMTFVSLEESLNHKEVLLESNMVMSDFLKMTHPQILHIAFSALDEFKKKNKRLPNPWSIPDAEDFIKLAEGPAKKLESYKPEEDKRYLPLLRLFSFTCQGVLGPLAALMGGFVAQEAIKGITQKFMPTKQFFYSDCWEIIPELPEDPSKLEEAIKSLGVVEKNHRTDGLRLICGEKLLTDIGSANVFMVGAGAIGCELLKNFAMVGLGTGQKGLITLTDPDVIETSNLNRQFLFREKHLRKPKSQTAAAAAIQMNKDLKGHIVARLDKVHEGTAHIFTNKFFEELTVVANALDNVHARRYVDSRCVNAKTPLLESGTLGPKGHVQVIIPYKTETYGSQQDPQEEGEIPHCTLKMFPEETLHCVEWARDKFGKIYSQRPKGLNKILDEIDKFEPSDSQEIKTLREAVSLLKKRPTNFQDCIKYARQKFQKYFVNDIRQLLYTYPIDAKTKEGNPFWSLPKRPPTEIAFDPKNPLHAHFVSACACLRANVFNIPIPKDSRTNEGRLKIAEEAAKVEVVDFKPSAEKAKEIASQVDKEVKKGEEEEKEADINAQADDDEVKNLMKDLKKFAEQLPKSKEGKILCCVPEEFEKDNDENFHIDIIYSMANCRSGNYKLEPMDWITVKLKAGRIIPALATTTACIAGLQTIELVKILKNCKLEDMKNAFMSLAVPILQLSEPGAPIKTKLTDKLEVTVWDRWEINISRNETLKHLFEAIEKKYELKPRDVIQGSENIYIHAVMEAHGKEKQKESVLNSKLSDLLDVDKEDKYVDLNVMMAPLKGGDILQGVPAVRVVFTD